MAATRGRVLSLYKNMLQEAQKFTGYNVRNYFLRRVKDGFREHKNETDISLVESLIKRAEENLAIMKRQAVISQLYKEPKIVLEKSTPTPLSST